MKKNTLLPEVAAVYRCTIEPTRIITRWGERLDLRTISLQQADELVARGLEELVRKPSKRSRNLS